MSKYPLIPMISMQVGQYYYYLLHIYRRFFQGKRIFTFQGRDFEYFEHPYNRTWLNERSIEVPLVWELVKTCNPADVLEIGNVLSHYYRFGHTIVDKYEKGRGVISQDVVELNLPRTYPLIVTISTLEHVGWDETPRQSGKHRVAISRLKELLSPGGRLVATFPIGYNLEMDEDLFADRLGFDEVYYFRRLTLETWLQADAVEVRKAQYNFPFRAANALVMGIVYNPVGNSG